MEWRGAPGGRPGRAKLNPSEAAGCRRRRAACGRAGNNASWLATKHHHASRGRSRSVGRSVDCYFGLERERVEGEREERVHFRYWTSNTESK